jgi:hypothetical protein
MGRRGHLGGDEVVPEGLEPASGQVGRAPGLEQPDGDRQEIGALGHRGARTARRGTTWLPSVPVAPVTDDMGASDAGWLSWACGTDMPDGLWVLTSDWSTEGFVALATTLLVYGVTELCHGYGFVAVFVAAYALRHLERDHEYHEVLHASSESVERLFSAALLVLLGGAVVDGALRALTWQGVAVGLAVILVVRPVAAGLALVRTGLPVGERAALAFFGIRGIGSVYYLAHALNEEDFGAPDQLWAITAFVILVSVVVHGVSAAPIMKRVDARREAATPERREATAPTPT